jgi:hypothetical protein
VPSRSIADRDIAGRRLLSGVAAVTILVLAGCRNVPLTSLERLAEARRLSADVLVQFSRTIDAGNRAVMADSDETSAAFVREAEAATNAVGNSADALAPVLREMNYADESRLLEQFATRFAEYRRLDRSILDLAVENTNLKAQRLSFRDAQGAADAFGNALQGVSAGLSDEAWHAQALASSAVAAVRQIQVLQGPHIAESDEAAMARLEGKAAEEEASARGALDALARVVRPAARPTIALAREALDRFTAINAQIVVLSRRNSNVRSLGLSLGQKRTLAATCDESLRALQDAVAQRGFTGTR